MCKECLTYHDLLVVYTELEKRQPTLLALWHDVVGKPAFHAKAREYSDQLNNLSHVLSKIAGILRERRAAARAAEAEETRNQETRNQDAPDPDIIEETFRRR